ncbi:MAG: 50S ribosomal protein L18 [Spirochaetota bacterium]
MNRLRLKTVRYERRRGRIKDQIKPVEEGRLRLCITRSNTSLYAQIIDDSKGHTVVSASSLAKDFPADKSRINMDAAKALGKVIAEKAKSKGVTKVFFDRNGILYHGKIKAFADSARENGLEF